MTKAELINEVANKTGLTKKYAEKAVSAVIESITDAMSMGDKVQLVGFGTFEVRDRAAREGKNPRYRRNHLDPRDQSPGFQGRQGAEGRDCEVIVFDCTRAGFLLACPFTFSVESERKSI